MATQKNFLTEEEAVALDRIATGSKMDCWVSIRNRRSVFGNGFQNAEVEEDERHGCGVFPLRKNTHDPL